MKLARTLSAGLTLMSLLALASCDFSQFGAYYYSATLQGYVMDAKTGGAGVANAVVYIYTKDPTSALKASPSTVPSGYVQVTSTSNANNNTGLYTSKVLWNNPSGAYGSKGDTTTVYAVVTHPDYAWTAFTLGGVLSDTTNNLVDLKVKRITFTTPSVTGRVIDASGNGVNNVRVVLFLTPAAQTAGTPDYVATTATANNVAGTFTFNNVTWHNTQQTAEIDTHDVIIKMDDANYSPTSDPLTPTLTSGSASDLTAEPTRASRNVHYDFSTNLAGRILIRRATTNGTTDSGVQGIHVVVSWYSADSTGTFVTHQAETDTNNQGNWTVFVQWTDPNPRNYDGDDGTDSTNQDATIDPGEDGLKVKVAFTNLKNPSTASTTYYQFNEVAYADGSSGSASASTYSFNLQSWRSPNNFFDGISNR